MSRLAELEFDRYGDLHVARVRGELDLSNAADVADAVAAAVTSGALGLVLDLTGLRHIDSAGLRELFGLRTKLAGRRQQIALVVTRSAPIMEVLEMAAVGDVIPLYSSLEGAAIAMRSARTRPA